jgi:hypothetical protein
MHHRHAAAQLLISVCCTVFHNNNNKKFWDKLSSSWICLSNVATMKKFLLATLLIVLGSRGVCTMKKYIQYETQKPNLVPFGLSENVRKQTPGLAHKALF